MTKNIKRELLPVSWWRRRQMATGNANPERIDGQRRSYTNQAEGDVFASVGTRRKAVLPAFARAAGNAKRLEEKRDTRDADRVECARLRESAEFTQSLRDFWAAVCDEHGENCELL